MPNWCSTSYNMCFDSKATADKANSILEYFQSNPLYEYLSGFGHSWLGNIIEFFGLSVTDNTFSVSCRGEINDWWHDERLIRIDTESAWTLMPDALLLFRMLGTCDIGYEAEEEGCDVFLNDGTIYDDEWMYEVEDHRDYLSTDAMSSLLKQLYEAEGFSFEADKSLTELVSFYDNHTEREDYFSIHKFDAVPLEELTSFSLEQAKERIKSSPIPVYEVRYKKDGEEYRTFVGVSDKERFMQAIDKLREAGYEMVSFTPCKKGRTAFELWLESTDRVREAAAV